MDNRKASPIKTEDLPIKKRPRPSPSASPAQQVKKLKKDITSLFKSSHPSKETKVSAPFGQQPTAEHDQIFKDTLKKLIIAIVTDLKPNHLAEILREIANFHRDQLKHAPAGKKLDLAFQALCLYEKAFTIEARNTLIDKDASTLVKIAPEVTKYKINSPDTLERKARFTRECKDMGFVAFFWKSIDRFLQQVNEFNGHFANNVIINLLNYLAKSQCIDAIIQKHVAADQINTVKAIFTEAFDVLTGHHTQVLGRV